MWIKTDAGKLVNLALATDIAAVCRNNGSKYLVSVCFGNVDTEVQLFAADSKAAAQAYIDELFGNLPQIS